MVSWCVSVMIYLRALQKQNYSQTDMCKYDKCSQGSWEIERVGLLDRLLKEYSKGNPQSMTQ